MKIGILTFHCAVNYGAVLQAYGLKQVLCSLGFEAHIIDYRPTYLVAAYKAWQQRPGLRSLTQTNGWVLWYKHFKACGRRYLRNKRFRSFCQRYLDIDKTQLSEIAKEYEVVVCGSDQIWNSKITGENLDPVYFGILLGGNQIKSIAYGASVGNNSNLHGHEEEFARMLRQMSAISVREYQLADHIARICPDVPINVVADPTILAGRDVFDHIASPKLVINPYLLYFDLTNDNRLRERAKAIADAKGLEFIELTTYHEYVDGQKLFSPVSPAGFCSLFKYADHVVSSSFHGTVFSILFEKQFEVFIYKNLAPDRIMCLLSELGIENRLLNEYSEFESRHEELAAPINYKPLRIRLNELRQTSLNFLTNALA